MFNNFQLESYFPGRTKGSIIREAVSKQIRFLVTDWNSLYKGTHYGKTIILKNTEIPTYLDVTGELDFENDKARKIKHSSYLRMVNLSAHMSECKTIYLYGCTV